MTSPLSRLRDRLRDAASLREWTIDANDGIIATAGLLEGFAGAGATDATLITAATVATVAGGLSLGGAKWAEEAAEREAQQAVVAEEAAQLEARPEDELAELTAYYVDRGLTADLAAQVAGQLMAKNALAAQLEAEHGIREVMSWSEPIVAGVGAAIAFMVGAAIPLLITVFAPVAIETWAILVAAIVSLTLTSLVGSRTGRMKFTRVLMRSLTVGIGTMVVSFLVGLLLF